MNECSAKKQGSEEEAFFTSTTIRHWKTTFFVHFQIMTWVQERFSFASKKLMIKNSNTSLKKKSENDFKNSLCPRDEKKKKNILV